MVTASLAPPIHGTWPHPSMVPGPTHPWYLAPPIHGTWPHPSMVPGPTHPWYLAPPIHGTWPHPSMVPGPTHPWYLAPPIYISMHTYMYNKMLPTPTHHHTSNYTHTCHYLTSPLCTHALTHALTAHLHREGPHS